MGLVLTEYKDADCPEVRHKRAGDESYDICALNGKACLEEHGLYECEYFNNYLKEMEVKNAGNNQNYK